MQKIQELEDKEGIKTKFDKKSMMRILERLSEKGKLQLYRPTVAIGDEEKKVDQSSTLLIHQLYDDYCPRGDLALGNHVTKGRRMKINLR